MNHIGPDDVLHFLVADTCTPSIMGHQLERLRFGLISAPDPFRARDDAEARIMEQAELLRCISEFKAVEEFRPTTPRSAGYKTLEKIQRVTCPRLPHGTIALNALRAYQQWGTQSQERALVAVFGYVRSIAPRVCPSLDMDAMAAVQAFREGNAKRSRELAASTCADALLALGCFLTKRAKR